MARRDKGGLAAFPVLLLAGGWIGGAAAQTAPLPSMPPPPSASEAAPAAAKAKAKAKKAPRKRAGEQSAPASSGSAMSFDRPSKFVPEEFDREGRRGAGGGAAPMMSPSGRPGMGMRF